MGETETQRQDRLWTPAFVLIIGATLCTFMVGQGTNAGTSVFIESIGGNATFAGILAAVFSVAAAVARLVSGPLVDRKGRRIVMMAGGILMLIGTIGPVFTYETWAFVLWRFLQGAGFSAVGTAAATAAADVLPASRLGEGIGYHNLGQAISMSVGPALAMFLVATDPATNLYLGLSVSAFGAFALSALVRYEKKFDALPETSAYRVRCEERARAGVKAERPTGRLVSLDSILEKGAIPGTIPLLILSPAFGFSIYFAGLLGTSLGVENAGLYYTLSAVTMILIRLKSKAFMDTVPSIVVMAVAAAGGVLAYALLIGANMLGAGSAIGEIMFYAAGLPYGICLGIALPVNQAIAVKNSRPERWGAANALYLLALDIGVGIACIIWGYANDTFGFTVTLCCAIVFVAGSFVAAWFCYPAEEKRWALRK